MLNDYIDIYCERLEPGLLAEPLNAVTNIAFLIAAFCAYKCAKNQNALDWRSALLIGLIATMGIGSALFHTFATLWAMMADIIPILSFQIIFIALYCQNVIKLKCRYSSLVLAGFFVTMYISMQLPRHWLNGTLEYAPALLFVTGLGLWHLKNAPREKWGLLAAAGLFTISMTLRSIDMQLCEALPIGTHFLWHCLNAGVLYLSARAFILNKTKI
jgi:hypothetical protein